MATFTYPTATANYNGGQPAVGRDVRDDLDEARDFIVGKNLEDTNIATMAGPLAWSITSNAKALDIVSTGDESLLTMTSEAELAQEIYVDRLSGSTDDTTEIIDLRRSGTSIFYASPEGSLLGPRIDETTRDAISSPRQGDVVYNTDTEAYSYYNNTEWAALGSTPPEVEISPSIATGISNTAQSFIQVQVSPSLTVVNGNVFLLFLQSQNTGGGRLQTTSSGSGGPQANSIASFRWSRSINGGGYSPFDEHTLSLNVSPAPATTIGVAVPLGAMTTADTGAVVVPGDTIQYKLEVDSAQNLEVASGNACKIIVVDL